MLNQNLDANSAAGQVGYESASQFSREYSRLFGIRHSAISGACDWSESRTGLRLLDLLGDGTGSSGKRPRWIARDVPHATRDRYTVESGCDAVTF